MIRFSFILTFLLALVNLSSADAQDTCYLGSWEFDAAYTYENGEYSPGGSMASMPIEFTQATGSAFLTFGNEGDFTYTFDSWSATFQSNTGPITTEVRVNLHGDVWGRYSPSGDEFLTMFMSGDGVPEPNIESSTVIILAGRSMDGPDNFESFFGPQTFGVEYRCEGDFLYINGESGGGAFRNSRYMRAN